MEGILPKKRERARSISANPMLRGILPSSVKPGETNVPPSPTSPSPIRDSNRHSQDFSPKVTNFLDHKDMEYDPRPESKTPEPKDPKIEIKIEDLKDYVKPEHRPSTGTIRVCVDSSKTEKATKIFNATIFDSCQTIIQKVLQMHSISEKWQMYALFMQFDSDNQLASLEGIELLTRDALRGLHQLIKSRKIELPKERQLNPGDFPLVLKQKFHRISDEPIFVVRNLSEIEPPKTLAPEVPVSRISFEDSSRASLEQRERKVSSTPPLQKRARSHTFSATLAPFLGKKITNNDTSDDESSGKKIDDGYKGTIKFCPDIAKSEEVESMTVTSSTPSQILIQNILARRGHEDRWHSFMLFLRMNGQERPLRYMEYPLLLKQRLQEGSVEPVFYLQNMREHWKGGANVEVIPVHYLISELQAPREKLTPLKYFEKGSEFLERALKEIEVTPANLLGLEVVMKAGDEERIIGGEESPTQLYSKMGQGSKIIIREKGGKKSEPIIRNSSSAHSLNRPSLASVPEITTTPPNSSRENLRSEDSGTDLASGGSSGLLSTIEGEAIIKMKLEVFEGDPIRDFKVQAIDKCQGVISHALEYFEIDSPESWKHYMLFLQFKDKERGLRSLENPASLHRKLAEVDQVPVFALRNVREAAKIRKNPEFFSSSLPPPFPTATSPESPKAPSPTTLKAPSPTPPTSQTITSQTSTTPPPSDKEEPQEATPRVRSQASEEEKQKIKVKRSSLTVENFNMEKEREKEREKAEKKERKERKEREKADKERDRERERDEEKERKKEKRRSRESGLRSMSVSTESANLPLFSLSSPTLSTVPGSPITPSDDSAPGLKRLSKNLDLQLGSNSSFASVFAVMDGQKAEDERQLTPEKPEADSKPVKPRRSRRLSKSLSTDNFNSETKESGTIRVALDTALEKTTVYRTVMVSSHDQVRDVIRIVLQKHNVPLDALKHFEIRLHFADTIKGRILLSKEIPLMIKKELTTPEYEPIFEIKDFRIKEEKVEAKVEEPVKKVRARSQTVSAMLPQNIPFLRKRPESDAPKSPDPPKIPDHERSPDKSDSEHKKHRRDSLSRPVIETIVAAAPDPSPEDTGLIRIHYQSNYKTLMVKQVDSVTVTLKDCFEKFSITETTENFSIYFIQDGRERLIRDDENLLTVKSKAERFNSSPVVFEIRDRTDEIKLIEQHKEKVEKRNRSSTLVPSIGAFKKRIDTEDLRTELMKKRLQTLTPPERPAPSPPERPDKDKDKDKDKEKSEKPEKTEDPPKQSRNPLRRRDRGMTVNTTLGPTGIGEIKGAVFGIDLQEQAKLEKQLIPRIVKQCVSYVERKALEMEGVYRLSGAASRVRALKHQISLDLQPDLDEELEFANITSLLKDYFRSLPVSLITPAVFQRILQISEEEGDGEEALLKCREEILKLPPAHYATLKFLAAHFDRITERSEENKMGVSNLAVVFGPTLIRAIESSDAFEDMRLQGKVMSLIIMHCRRLFEDIAPPVVIPLPIESPASPLIETPPISN